jgi:hypothetical protein
MRRRLLVMSASLLVPVLLLVVPAASVGATAPKLLSFDTMTGVPLAYTGSANPVRGISGGGLPWVIGYAKGELTTSGSLDLKIRGLVLDPNDPTVISRGLAGNNPIPSFRAIVSCLTSDGGMANVSTDAFPATTGVGGGDARIRADLALPAPCLAPLVFVTSPGLAWFAVSGG